jgi:hypothetical protein
MAAEEAETPAESGDDTQADLDEVKRKFRAALDRKKQQHATSADSAEKTGRLHEAHGPAAKRRSFRRKSGG